MEHNIKNTPSLYLAAPVAKVSVITTTTTPVGV